MPTVRPGITVPFVITLQDQDRNLRIGAAPVQLQQFQEAIGDFSPVQTLITGLNGEARGTLALPSTPGRYRYRAHFPGTTEVRPDNGPAETFDVVAA